MPTAPQRCQEVRRVYQKDKHWSSRGLQSHSEERVSKQTNVYVHDSNSAQVVQNPEDIRVVPWVFSTYALLQNKT